MENEEDFSDLVAEHAAKESVRKWEKDIAYCFLFLKYCSVNERPKSRGGRRVPLEDPHPERNTRISSFDVMNQR
jgi:hypothetical protein